MELSQISWSRGLAVLLAVFFLMGAAGNILALGEIPADYARWGFPIWFRFVTGVVELTAAILLLWPSTRFSGAAVGLLVMGAACATVIFHGEVGRAIAPLVVFAVCAVVAWINRPKAIGAPPVRSSTD